MPPRDGEAKTFKTGTCLSTSDPTDARKALAKALATFLAPIPKAAKTRSNVATTISRNHRSVGLVCSRHSLKSECIVRGKGEGDREGVRACHSSLRRRAQRVIGGSFLKFEFLYQGKNGIFTRRVVSKFSNTFTFLDVSPHHTAPRCLLRVIIGGEVNLHPC